MTTSSFLATGPTRRDSAPVARFPPRDVAGQRPLLPAIPLSGLDEVVVVGRPRSFSVGDKDAVTAFASNLMLMMAAMNEVCGHPWRIRVHQRVRQAVGSGEGSTGRGRVDVAAAENMRLGQLAGLHHVYVNFERVIEREVGPGVGRVPPGRHIVLGIKTVQPASLTRRPRAEPELAINIPLDPHDEDLTLTRSQTAREVERPMSGFVGAGRSDGDIRIGGLGEGRRVTQRTGMTGPPSGRASLDQ